MKKLAVLSILALLNIFTKAYDIPLSWQVNDPTNTLKGFYLYAGTNSSNYNIATNFIAGGSQTNGAISNLLAVKKYFINAKTIGTNGLVSDFSTNELITTIPKPMNNLVFGGDNLVVLVEVSADGNSNWQMFTNMIFPEPWAIYANPKLFYRSKLFWAKVNTNSPPPIPAAMLKPRVK